MHDCLASTLREAGFFMCLAVYAKSEAQSAFNESAMLGIHYSHLGSETDPQGSSQLPNEA